MGRGNKPPNVSEFLRQLADMIDSSDVAVVGTSVDRPCVSSHQGWSVVTWNPEIQFIAIGEHTQRLVDMLNRYA